MAKKHADSIAVYFVAIFATQGIKTWSQHARRFRVLVPVSMLPAVSPKHAFARKDEAVRLARIEMMRQYPDTNVRRIDLLVEVGGFTAQDKGVDIVLTPKA